MSYDGLSWVRSDVMDVPALLDISVKQIVTGHISLSFVSPAKLTIRIRAVPERGVSN